MKIRIIGINYAPELIGIGWYNTGMAEFLAERGHEVSMVTTFPYYPAWEKRAEDRGRWSAEESVKGVRVLRCWHYVPRRVTAWRRILHEASFVLTSFLRQLAWPAPEVFVVVSPPLLLGAATWLLARLQRAPFVFHVQDLQPDAAVQLGMLRPAWLAAPLYWLEKFAYRRAARVSVISPEMEKAVQARGLPPERVAWFPNWVSMGEPWPSAAESKAQLGFPARARVISYAGNLGEKQGVLVLAETARHLRNAPEVILVVAGEGPGAARLVECKEREGLAQLQLRGLLPEAEHTALLRASELCLLPQRPGSGAAFLPSKLLKILACERPIITNADEQSALAGAVREGQFGELVAPDDARTLAAAILRLLADPAQLARLGAAGRRYVQRFEKQAVLTRFAEMLETLAAGAR